MDYKGLFWGLLAGAVSVVVVSGIFIGIPSGGQGGVSLLPSFNTASSTLYSAPASLSHEILAQKGGRTYASFCNTHAVNAAYLSWSSTQITSTTYASVRIAAGECFEIDRENLYVGEVQALGETATTTSLLVTELR